MSVADLSGGCEVGQVLKFRWLDFNHRVATEQNYASDVIVTGVFDGLGDEIPRSLAGRFGAAFRCVHYENRANSAVNFYRLNSRKGKNEQSDDDAAHQNDEPFPCRCHAQQKFARPPQRSPQNWQQKQPQRIDEPHPNRLPKVCHSNKRSSGLKSCHHQRPYSSVGMQCGSTTCHSLLATCHPLPSRLPTSRFANKFWRGRSIALPIRSVPRPVPFIKPALILQR